MNIFEAPSIEIVLRYLASALLIALGIALQFVPLYERTLQPWYTRYPLLKVLRFRLVQLFIGFGLLSVGIQLLRITPGS